MQQTHRERIHLMDELRGFAVFCMVFYHGFYTLGFLYSSDFGMYWLRFFSPAEPWFAGLFILIAGISSNLTHSNLVRGLKLLAVSLLLTLVTVVFLPADQIIFGILHFLSVCMIAFGLLQLYSKKRDKKLAVEAQPKQFKLWPVLVCAALFALTYNISRGFIGFSALSATLPPPPNDLLAPFGWHTSAFFSSDYFPLLPWAFVFAAGTMLGRLAAAGRFPKWMYPSRVPILEWLGRHALIIYIVHQPIIYGAAMLMQELK